MIIEEKGRIRLHTIGRLIGNNPTTTEFNVQDLPIKEGLGIEYRYDDEHYIVISFIKYDSTIDEVILDMVDDRILDIPTNEFNNFKELARKGIELVKSAQDEEDE